MIMNRLNAFTLTVTFAAGLYSATTFADEITAQVQTAAVEQLTNLQQSTRQQARMALSKAVFDLLAQRSAAQDAAAVMLAQQTVPVTPVVAE
jgi:hypothetical protein